jgi:hypothetical protein
VAGACFSKFLLLLPPASALLGIIPKLQPRMLIELLYQPIVFQASDMKRIQLIKGFFLKSIYSPFKNSSKPLIQLQQLPDSGLSRDRRH